MTVVAEMTETQDQELEVCGVTYQDGERTLVCVELAGHRGFHHDQEDHGWPWRGEELEWPAW